MPFYCHRAVVLKSSAVICSTVRPLQPLRIGGPAKSLNMCTHTHTRTHSLPYFESTSRTIRCLLEATVYSLLTYGWRSMAAAAPTERMNIKASAQQCGGARAKGSVLFCFVATSVHACARLCLSAHRTKINLVVVVVFFLSITSFLDKHFD